VSADDDEGDDDYGDDDQRMADHGIAEGDFLAGLQELYQPTQASTIS
jgi:hypothetical protein